GLEITAGLTGHGVLAVLVALRERLGLVRNLPALDDAHAGWARTNRAGHDDGRGTAFVLFEVPVGAAEGLPDAVQVRFPVPCGPWNGPTRRLHGTFGDNSKAGRGERCSREDKDKLSRHTRHGKLPLDRRD